MKQAIQTLFVMFFSLVMAATLAGFAGGCAYHEESADAELPYACDEGEPIAPPDGECIHLTGRFRLGGIQRGACHDVWDELTEATVCSQMVIVGEYYEK